MNFVPDDGMLTFIICLLVGGGVLFKYCVEQFDKSTQSKSENDPWPFIVPKFLASPRQYLLGFSLYFGILLFIFLFFSFLSFLKPEVVAKIFASITNASGGVSASANSSHGGSSIFGPTSPILIAFWLVGLNSSLPNFLNVELVIRKLGHRMAYIPRGMNDIFVFLRYTGYSDFTMPERELKGAWNEIGVRPVKSELDDVKPVVELINHVTFLYGRAATLAGELNLPIATAISDGLNIDVFRTYRSDIQRVLTMLQAAHGRIVEQIAVPQDDHSEAVQEIQRDLNKGLEFLYTLFACAITAKGTERLSERLRAFGILKVYPVKPQIPWNPILIVTGACAFVLFAGWWTAAQLFLSSDGAAASVIPRDPVDIARWLINAFIVHIIAIALATRIRIRLMDRDKYLSATASTNVAAYVIIFAKCAGVSFLCYILLNLPIVLSVLFSGLPLDVLARFLLSYLAFCAAWMIVPAACGLMTAFTLDRRCVTLTDRALSGFFEAVVMGFAALFAVEVVMRASPFLAPPVELVPAFRLFNIIIYSGLGLVFGFTLPLAIMRHRKALESRLPERIVALRSAVFSNFFDMEDFNRWLQAADVRLGGRRPLDVLAEETGLQALIDFVRTSRAAPAAT